MNKNTLATSYPEIAKEWHPTKNGDLKPTDVATCSNRRVWWLMPYDDPKSGRHFEFEWQASIYNRVTGDGCPYLSGAAVWEGFNDLATLRPDIAKEWHPTKNGDLKPTDVTVGSVKRVWWQLPYDDPKSGRHYEFEWEASISNRTVGNGCPYLSGAAVWEGFNDLATLFPDIAKEWHPTKNGDLKPTDVTAHSGRNVWWLLPYDDPKSGRHFEFEWRASINSRTAGIGCPYLSGAAVWEGFNDLATLRPDIAKEWHPTKNGDLKPTDVTACSNECVWWKLPYDDPKSGRHYEFEWEASINNRTSGRDCPYLSGAAVWEGFNDLATLFPDIAKEWHPTKNGDLRPTDVTARSGRNVWWQLPYDDPKSGRHFEFEWAASINSRTAGIGCPYLSGKAAWEGFNDLATLRPDIAKEWHPTKNGDLKPTDVTVGSGKRVWWQLPYDDPKSGHHFEFEWEASISNRTIGRGCPYLSGKAVWEGFNDLATLFPDIAKEWHPTKNGDLKPTDVVARSNRRVWWLLSYDDPKSGRHFEFEWEASINNRTAGDGCPYLSGKAVWEGFNDLATLRPDIAKEWHPTKNGDLKPTDVTVGSVKRVWWQLPYDDPKSGRHFEFEWEASTSNRTIGHGCPYLSGVAVWEGFNDLATLRPDIAKEWHPTKNGDLRPTDVTVCSGSNVWWLLPYDDPKSGLHFEFEWQSCINNRIAGNGCPYLSGKAAWEGFNDLATLRPDIAKEWHPTKNGDLKPTDVTVGSGKRVWWLLPYDDPKSGLHFEFEWQASISNRVAGNGCPYLLGKAVWEGFNDLATLHPDIAKSWHPAKNGDLKPTDVTARSNRRVWWCCEKCGFCWRSRVFAQVIKGPLCEECKRRIEETL